LKQSFVKVFEHFVVEVLDFSIDNSTTMIPAEDSNYRIIQSIGALGTILAFVFQTFILRGQINLLGDRQMTSTQTGLLQN
jgi:hypothetical protein